MDKDYLIVHKEILPDYYMKVIEARTLINEKQVSNVSEAVKAVGISRSTYYKYKDYIFLPDETTSQRKAVISFSLMHEAGSLSSVLSELAHYHVNVLTISQSIPIDHKANVTMSLDISNLSSIDIMMHALKEIDKVINVSLLSIE